MQMCFRLSLKSERMETSLLLDILLFVRLLVSLCNYHSTAALVHAEKMTHLLHKMEKHKRGQREGSHLCFVFKRY